MEATREQIKATYQNYPDHILKHVIQFNTISTSGAPQNAIVEEKRLVADVARELLNERGE